MKIAIAMLAVSALLITGCRVDKETSGNGKNVKIATPFGGMTVKTDEAGVQGAVGLAVYPGATLVKKDNDNNAADVNIGFGSFQLRVKAVSYRTSDSPDKVMAFYRKDLARYGAVILCHGHTAIGQPTTTQDGLGCDDSSHNTVHTGEGGSEGELKAGSKQHLHMVAVDREGGGTKFGLVSLDLPGQLTNSGKGDSEQ